MQKESIITDQEKMELTSGSFKLPKGFFDHLYIELTDHCNLRCKHCYLSAGHMKKNQLDVIEVEKLLYAFKENGGQSVAFSGGEPLLYPNLDVLLMLAKKLDLQSSLMTNCTLLTKAQIDKYLNLGILFSISLEGRKESSHDYIRGKGNYQKVRQVLDILIYFGAQDRTIICYTPMKHNYNEFFPLVNEYANLGFTNFYLSLLEERGRQIEYKTELSLSIDEKSNLITQLAFLLIHTHSYLNIDFGHLTQFLYRVLRITEWDGSDDIIEGTLRVSSEGDIFLSAYSEGNLFNIGNLKMKGISRALNIEKLQRLFNILKHRTSNSGECQFCEYRIICGGGSAARAYTLHKDILKTDDYCNAKKVFLGKWF